MSATIDNITPVLQSKLQHLVEFLQQLRRGFENLAEEIEHTSLRSAMKTISMESKQYAKEIADQFRQVEFAMNTTKDDIWMKMEVKVNEEANAARGSEIAALCRNCESYFNTLYAEVLAGLSPEHTAREIISFQLYAINCALMKIRLLNHTRFEEQHV